MGVHVPGNIVLDDSNPILNRSCENLLHGRKLVLRFSSMHRTLCMKSLHKALIILIPVAYSIPGGGTLAADNFKDYENTHVTCISRNHARLKVRMLHVIP